MTIAALRYTFSDYTIPHLPPLKTWKEYSYHIQESSMRSAVNAETKINGFLTGGTLSNQVWVDLKGVYGLSDSRLSINTLGHNFISYCATAPTNFAKEAWLYRAQKNSIDTEIRFKFNRRLRNLHTLLSFIPHSLVHRVFDNSLESNKMLAFSEHLIQYPLALKKFFELPWADIVSLTNRTDTQFEQLITVLTPTERNLDPFLRRVKTFNREPERRLVFVASMLIAPTLDRIDHLGSSPLILHYPYNRFFIDQDLIRYLNHIGPYMVH
ncbi:hypothetical protein [Neobacillus sp. PS3-40]|uniref:hypothetical protein n=1 Tax=Neobacillus sp. PS3-40 TaxID=3070679 RepID=UPI0027DF4B88|nr:hypothetical protein [Neobacillus sp. PS3-40]WML43144.1 hypothetical protein RCG20_15220 [Neobacillus sp. PS3-40]